MGLFTTKVDVDAEEREDELLEEIRSLRTELRRVEDIKKEQAERLRAVDQIAALRKQITDLEISKDKLKEDNEREVREVKHLVTLEKKRQEFEIESGKRDAVLKVREENLAADRARFEEQLAFNNQRFEEQVNYLKGMVGSILDRLPTVTVDRTIEEAKPAPRRRTSGS